MGYQGESARSVSQRHSASRLERDPNRNSQSPREMRDRGVAGDDEIEAGHRRRRIDECVGARVEIGAERLDPQRGRQIGKLLLARAFLQRDESHARDRGERRERRERHGAGSIGLRIGIALPDHADLEAFGADALQPHFA